VIAIYELARVDFDNWIRRNRRRGWMKLDRTEENVAKKGGKPNADGGGEALTTEERSLDIGESGQFAPGGYYNQRGVNESDRRSLNDDDVVPPGRR
jgi:hypothetical protein